MGLDIRTVLFDLDGTIYQNLTFNRIYIRNLTAGTPFASWQESLLAYTEEVFAGRRLIMNRAYSTLPLPAPDPESYFAALEGALLPDLSYEELLQQEHCLFLGDAWAVLALLGKTLGLLEGPRLDAVYRMSRRESGARRFWSATPMRIRPGIFSASWDMTGSFPAAVFLPESPAGWKRRSTTWSPGSCRNPADC